MRFDEPSERGLVAIASRFEVRSLLGSHGSRVGHSSEPTDWYRYRDRNRRLAAMKGNLAVTGDPEADKLLNTDSLALMIGMLLDQQVPMEWAFTSPAKLRERLGGELDAAAIASLPPEELGTAFKGPPALHRFPGSMAKRTQQLAQHLVEHYGGDAAAVWERAEDAGDLYARIKALPGYGEEKSRIFLALLAKRFGVAPEGWESYAGPFADTTPRSVADIDSAETLAESPRVEARPEGAGQGQGRLGAARFEPSVSQPGNRLLVFSDELASNASSDREPSAPRHLEQGARAER